MRVAVITTSYDEPADQLARCVSSVQGQRYPGDFAQFVLRDRAGSGDVAGAQRTIWLGKPHADWGDTARAVGALCAINEGFEAVCWIDGDNWIQPNHLASMVDRHRETSADVITATRTLHRLDGSLMYTCPESTGRKHCDANCLFLTSAAFRLAPLWAFVPPTLHSLGDRLIWQAARKMHSCAHVDSPTVCYRTKYAIHYELIGETPPDGAKSTNPTPLQEVDFFPWHFVAR